MVREIRTHDAVPSFSNYAQAVEIPPNARTLRVSGQVGAHPDGKLAHGVRDQITQAWLNVFAILAAADMGKEDIVDMLVLLKSADAVPMFRDIRDQMLAGHRAASTMMIGGLANPDWEVEIAVTAARVD